MSNPFVAEIRVVAFNFAPKGWASCDGQLLPISQNTALFSLLGTNYGGDGKTNFALPNFQGSAPMHWGSGAGLSQYVVGETGGAENVTLLQAELAAHPHTVQGRPVPGNLTKPANTNTLARVNPTTSEIYKAPAGAATVTMNPLSIGPAGGGQPHNNMQPYLCLFFVIAMQGVFPARN
jgi:microcystin-dependent protein